MEYMTSGFYRNVPKYIKSSDGYIGVFQYFDFGVFPVYKFPGGYRVADDIEIARGSNDRKELENKINKGVKK